MPLGILLIKPLPPLSISLHNLSPLLFRCKASILLAIRIQNHYTHHSTAHGARRTCFPVPCSSTLVESPLVALQPNIPEVYQDLREVFSKTRATCHPPHRPWDCAIDLRADATPPHRRIYPLSVAETQAMEDYIQELIRMSTSPVSAGFFFMAKKDGGLRPCIDYRGLNDITKKLR